MRVVQGEVLGVAVDLRRSSSTFGCWTGVKLSAETNTQFWIPEGFAHGFCMLSGTAEFLYKTTDYWHSEHVRSSVWIDPDIGIEWGLSGDPILAEKDGTGCRLADAEIYE